MFAMIYKRWLLWRLYRASQSKLWCEHEGKTEWAQGWDLKIKYLQLLLDGYTSEDVARRLCEGH